jgi:sugar diacid utilization regulator
VHSDDPAELIAAAGLVARRPLALVGAHGDPLGYAPEGSAGRRALGVARAAACNHLVGAAGWRIVPIARGSASLGFLVIGVEDGADSAARELIDALPELVAEQLHRVALLSAHQGAFVRRLVSDPRFGARQARLEASDLGLPLADAYWPAILTWYGVAPPAAVVERLARQALGRVEGGLTAHLDRDIALLHPRGEDGGEPQAWFAEIVAQARALAPSFRAQAIAADEAVELARVGSAIAELAGLRRLGPRDEDSRAVVSSRDYALERLAWEHLDATAARRFVDQQLGRLATWDHEHRTDLLCVLEAALDFPRHDQAARNCYMHRNTFRHRLRQATDALGAKLEDPDVRLAVHVALKLRRLLTAAPTEDGPPPDPATGIMRGHERGTAARRRDPGGGSGGRARARRGR